MLRQLTIIQRSVSIYICAVFTLLNTAISADPKLRDEAFARYACILATHRLHKNISDEKGLILLRLSGTLNSKNPDFLYNFNLIKRGLKPDPIPTKVTEAIYFNKMEEQIVYLEEHYAKRYPQVQRLQALYAAVLLKFNPRNRTGATTIERLNIAGVDTNLENLLSTPLDLKKIYSTPASKLEPAQSSAQAITSSNPDIVDLNVAIDVNEGEEQLRKYFFVDHSMLYQDLDDIGIKKKRKRNFVAWMVFDPKSKTGLKSRYGFVGDAVFRFRGNFEEMQLKVGPYKVEFPDKTLATCNMFRVKIEKDKLIMEAGRKVFLPVKELRIRPPSPQSPYQVELSAYRSNPPAKIYWLRLGGKAILCRE